METVAEEILREILLRLPTRDVACCGCVCTLWRRIVGDPSFRLLHANAAHVISGAGVEPLLVSQRRQQGMTTETMVFSVASAKLMCRVTDLAEEYRVASVCNGFLLLASGEREDPVFVCNPVTGEKLKVPAPPLLNSIRCHFFAMGFTSLSAHHQYKIFRIPLGESPVDDNFLEVYTFGGSDSLGWRRHPDHFERHGAWRAGSTPSSVNGKLYLVMKQMIDHRRTVNKILVIDVDSEASCTCRLPPEYEASHRHTTLIHIFDLGGQPCVAINVRDKLCLWVMTTPQMVQGAHHMQLDKTLLPGDVWVRRYSFISSFVNEPKGIWVDDDGILCCLTGDLMYKYDTSKDKKDKEGYNVGFLAWDHKLWLSPLPSHDNRRHKIYGGYRPTLLSPRDLATEQHDLSGEELEHAWLGSLRCRKSNKRHRSSYVYNGSRTAYWEDDQ